MKENKISTSSPSTGKQDGTHHIILKKYVSVDLLKFSVAEYSELLITKGTRSLIEKSVTMDVADERRGHAAGLLLNSLLDLIILVSTSLEE